MAKLTKAEKESLKTFAELDKLRNLPVPIMKLEQFIQSISSFPENLIFTKPVRFKGDNWVL